MFAVKTHHDPVTILKIKRM